VLAASQDAVLLLARGSELDLSARAEDRPALAELIDCLGEPAVVWIAATASRQELEAQRARLERDLSRLRQEEAELREKTHSAEFLARAPAPVVEKAHTRLAEAAQRLQALEGQLAEIEKALA
jgi:valyl-tRNA synthetase